MGRVATIALAISLVVPAIRAQPRKAPAFELDPKWPSIPNNWVLGEVTSISVDRKDHIWVLHVPQSIPEPQRASTASSWTPTTSCGSAGAAGGRGRPLPAAAT